MTRFLLLILSCLGVNVAVAAAAAVSARPNVVFILADDLGYADLGSYGGALIETPHLDRLATDGMRFTQAYAGSSVCAPSRAALLTGKHMGHASVRHNQKAGDDLEPGELTLGSLLQRAGYVTACIGKWGVGYAPAPTSPNAHGFDHFFGYVDMWHAHNSYPEFLWRNGEKVPLRNEVERLTSHVKNPLVGYATKKIDFSPELTTREALTWLDQRSDPRPFFLYLPFTIPHENGEAQFQDQRVEVPDLGIYADRDWSPDEKAKAALVTYLDDQVGQLLAKLTAKGFASNTLVIFTSDNGAGDQWDARFRSNQPFSGDKHTFREGGIRVPLIARWPGRIAPNSISHHPTAFWDIMPTLAELASVDSPSQTDGLSLVPTLLGQGSQPEHEYLYWEMPAADLFEQAVRWGNWKAIKSIRRTHTDFELYDLSADPAERFNSAAQHPEIVHRIELQMKASHSHREGSHHPHG